MCKSDCVARPLEGGGETGEVAGIEVVALNRKGFAGGATPFEVAQNGQGVFQAGELGAGLQKLGVDGGPQLAAFFF